MQLHRFAALSLLLTACASAPESSAAPESAAAPESPPVSLDGWISERIALPPGFAPSLPAGEELLLFAPGWRDAESEEFWAYALAIRLDMAAPDANALDEFLEAYYDGLLVAVGASKIPDLGTDPAQVTVRHLDGGRYEAEIDMIDSFTTLEPIRLRLRIDVESEGARSLLRIQASPQDPDHDIWRSLQHAAETLEP